MRKDDKRYENFRELESGDPNFHMKESGQARTVIDLSGCHWLMERMRPGQGKAEGIHLLQNELSGNDFSWNAATVPGDVYTDLYHAGELDDPHFGRNMGKAKWVGDYEWWYTHAFAVPENLKGKDIFLVFEGIDYSCEVFLNGQTLGQNTGMFSSFSYNVSDLVSFTPSHVPDNLLTVKVDPPPKNQKNIAGMKHNFAGDYLTGLVPFGIWRPIKLIATHKVKIGNYRIETKVGEDDRADVRIDGEVSCLQKQGNLALTVRAELTKDGETHIGLQEVNLSTGENTFSLQIPIAEAALWWPYELGTPNLYALKISVFQNEMELDRITDNVGLREIKMQMNPGFTEEEAEIPWTFCINGKPMFLRSACWGGQPSFFYERNSREKYRFYLEKAKECNINNLRIFGWHPPEVSDFYEICDELGITVWTNFPLATQVFRDDVPYVEDVLESSRQIVLDRRNHPSMVMWMGGEEVYFSEAHVQSGNKRLIQKIGEVTRSLTDVPYADASPLSSREGIRMGYKPKESMHANSHYYAAGAVFMEDYYPALDCCIVPELTAASSPDIESLKKFIPEDELWPMGLSWGYHMGNIDLLQTLNYEVFGSICMDSLTQFVTATQIAQGTIFQFALEHFRRLKPRVSGVSLCHFITNWPIIKWDIIDYYGQEKRSFAFVKQSYNPLLPSLQFQKRRYVPGESFKGSLWVVNDLYEMYSQVTYTCKIYTTTNSDLGVFMAEGNFSSDTWKCVKEVETVVDIEPNSSKEFETVQWDVEGSIGDRFAIGICLKNSEGTVLAENCYTLMVDDQTKAMVEAKALYVQGRAIRNQFSRGYYRFTPQCIDNR
ncbi:MAG: glycoside hydrolase family 2 TIM barrel-domain containing protein [Sphaerochaeta sp.]|nr:glycoside hydrolase family 2 TIM barrel-domain containing protein [Sphaerochaeta sp.]